MNYKDNNQYDVSIQQFQLTRDASEPFLYNYNITMRAYNLRNADEAEIALDVRDRKEALGLKLNVQLIVLLMLLKGLGYNGIGF